MVFMDRQSEEGSLKTALDAPQDLLIAQERAQLPAEPAVQVEALRQIFASGSVLLQAQIVFRPLERV